LDITGHGIMYPIVTFLSVTVMRRHAFNQGERLIGLKKE